MTTCECDSLPSTFFLDEAPDGWLDRLVEDTTGDWKTLRHCNECQRFFSVDAWDKYQDRIVALIADPSHWESEADGADHRADAADRRKELLLQARGGTGEGECIWAGCGGTRVRGVAYCIDHLWNTGARR